MRLLVVMISKMESSKPIILLGAGGHAKVIIEALRKSNRTIIGLTDPDKLEASEFHGVKVLGDDTAVFKYAPDDVLLVNGVGAMPNNTLRYKLNERMKENGFQFTSVIHPSAVIANDVEISSGSQIMAGTVIQPGVFVGESSIINTGVILDHDCFIHEDCHIAPGVTLSGNVTIGKQSHIGTGASIIQGITIGQYCIIAAGSVVYEDVHSNTKYIQIRNKRLEEVS